MHSVIILFSETSPPNSVANHRGCRWFCWSGTRCCSGGWNRVLRHGKASGKGAGKHAQRGNARARGSPSRCCAPWVPAAACVRVPAETGTARAATAESGAAARTACLVRCGRCRARFGYSSGLSLPALTAVSSAQWSALSTLLISRPEQTLNKLVSVFLYNTTLCSADGFCFSSAPAQLWLLGHVLKSGAQITNLAIQKDLLST